jgi:hypothetical protein
MSSMAEFLKKSTIERYEYLVNDGYSKYEALLEESLAQPDSYWENMAQAVEIYR